MVHFILCLQRFSDYVRANLGESGECDMRDIGECIFWPMTQVLFGDEASKEKSPFLLKSFLDIDNSFGAALKGKILPEVWKSHANTKQHQTLTFPLCFR